MDLSYKKNGNGSPLIILHGVFGSKDNWFTLGSKLQGFEIYFADLRNHGDSPWSQDFTVQDLAQDLEDFLVARKLPKAIFIGHSLGGKSVMELALAKPELVEAFVSVDMAPREYEAKYDSFIPALLSLNLETLQSRGEAFELLSTKITDKATLQFLLKNLVITSAGEKSWKLNLEVLNKKYNEIWKPLQTGRVYSKPAYFLTGGASDFVRPEDKSLILSLFPNAEFDVVEGAGHWLNAEKPQEVLTKLQTWLNRHIN